MKIWDAEPGFQARFEARFPEWGKRPFNDNSTYADEEFYPQWDVPHATSNQAKSDWEEYGVDTSQVIATLNVKRDDDVWLEGTFSHSGPRRWAVLDEPWLNYGWCDTEVTFSVSKAQVAPLY